MPSAAERTRAVRRPGPAAVEGRARPWAVHPAVRARWPDGLRRGPFVPPRSPGPGVQDRQVSSRLTLPVGGTVAVRFAPVSQVTLPAPSLRRYLYWKEVPAGRPTSSFHTG